MTGKDQNAERYKIMLQAATMAVRSYGLSAEDAEDLIQEAMVRLLQHLDRLPDKSRVLASFSRITAKRTVIDYFRAVARRTPYENRMMFVDTVGEGETTASHSVLSVVASYTPGETDPYRDDFIAEFLARLTKRHRQTLILCATGYTYKEIAEATGVSRGTVRSRIHYARKRAQRELKPLLG